MAKTARQIGCVLAALVITACGGGGGGSGGSFLPIASAPTAATPADPPATACTDPTCGVPPVPSSPSVSYAPKAFQFSWAGLSQASFYRLGEDPTNSGNFSVLADKLTGTSYTLQDLLLFEPPPAYRYALQACNSTGCSPWSAPVLPDPAKAIGYFKRPASSSPGLFGGSSQSSIALSPDGSLMAIAQINNGEVQLYRKDAGAWAWVQALVDPGGSTVFTPSSLSFSGEGTLLVGSTKSGSSKVNVYTRGASAWSLDDSWSPPSGSLTYSFGQSVSVSLDGTVAVVSEVGGPPDFPAGTFYVYRKTSGHWALEQRIDSPSGEQSGLFGVYAAISADGSTVVAGAQYESSDGLGQAGAAYVYSKPSGSATWVLNTRLQASEAKAGAIFGGAVGVSGNGDVVAIGARYETDAGLANAGALYVFRRNGATYDLEQRISAPVPQVNAVFGGYVASLSSDGSLLATSALQDGSTSAGVNGPMTPGGSNVGAAFLYEKGASGWQLKSFIKAPNADNEDRFGTALALSGDGRTMAVSARGEASTATGIGGDQSDNSAPTTDRGAVYLY